MFWEILLLCLGMALFSLVVFIVANWSDLHTVGDFLTPVSEDPVDSIILYIPGVNLAVTAVVLGVLFVMVVEKVFKSKPMSKLLSPLRKFFEIKLK